MTPAHKLYLLIIRGIKRFLSLVGLFPHRDLAKHGGAKGWSTPRKWRYSLLTIYDFENFSPLDLPWWTFHAIDEVEEFLRKNPDSKVFEWGSGASTLWLSKRAATVVSVEYDSEWYEKLAQALGRSPESSNVELRLSSAFPIQEGKEPVVSRKKGFESLDFSKYVAELENSQGQYDLIVIDGRARRDCLALAQSRIRPGGIIVYDNVERERERTAVNSLADGFDVLWTKGLAPCLPYPSQTALMRKR